MRRLLHRIESALDLSIALLIDLVRAAAHPLTDAASDYITLLELIDEARFVLIGEASHGTSSICGHLCWWRLGSAQGLWLPSAA
jgi:erythromycin esterase-like protein